MSKNFKLLLLLFTAIGFSPGGSRLHGVFDTHVILPRHWGSHSVVAVYVYISQNVLIHLNFKCGYTELNLFALFLCTLSPKNACDPAHKSVPFYVLLYGMYGVNVWCFWYMCNVSVMWSISSACDGYEKEGGTTKIETVFCTHWFWWIQQQLIDVEVEAPEEGANEEEVK
jgi:hypothetical protein